MKTMKDLYDAEIARMATMGDAHAERAVREGTSRTVAKARNLFDYYGTAPKDVDWKKAFYLAYAGATVTMSSSVHDSWKGVFADNVCGAPSRGSALAVTVDYTEGRQDSAKACQCGSGSNLIGPGHSDWCQCYKV